MPQTEIQDAPATASTPYSLTIGDSLMGTIGPSDPVDGFDQDWIRVNLDAGVMYYFTLTDEPGDYTRIEVVLPSGVWLGYSNRLDDPDTETLAFRPIEGGEYFIQVYNSNAETSSYTLTWATPPDNYEVTDLPQTSATTSAMTDDHTWFRGYLAADDAGDWISFDAQAGAIYTLSYDTGADTYDFLNEAVLDDVDVSVFDADGNLISTGNPDSGPREFEFGADTDTTLFINATRASDGASGPYQIRVEQTGSVAVGSADEMADYLQLGYWRDFEQSLNDTYGTNTPLPTRAPIFREPGNVIEVNLDALTEDQKDLVRMGLEVWSDVADVQFTEGNTVRYLVPETQQFSYEGAMTFVTREFVAFEGVGAATSEGTLINSQVQIATGRFQNGLTPTAADWSALLGLIGKGLGLGLLSASSDPVFAADSPQVSLMASQNQSDNIFLFASDASPVSLMTLDYLAIQELYGAASVDPTLGNTIWGTGSTLGGYGATLFDGFVAGSGEAVAYTIRDGGGIDTLRLVGSASDNRVDLMDGAVSDIGGLVGNLVIAPGSVIEHVESGSGDDVVSGNEANNDLAGADGNDTLFGQNGADTLRGGDGADRLAGGTGDDLLTGGAQNDSLVGNQGDDTIYGGEDADTLEGLLGNDLLGGGSGVLVP